MNNYKGYEFTSQMFKGVYLITASREGVPCFAEKLATSYEDAVTKLKLTIDRHIAKRDKLK